MSSGRARWGHGAVGGRERLEQGGKDGGGWMEGQRENDRPGELVRERPVKTSTDSPQRVGLIGADKKIKGVPW